MNNGYQDQQGTLPLSSFAPYVTNTTRSLWGEGIGGAVRSLVQSTENKLSQWFWDGIGSLPKDYFSQEITNVNYADKSLWEGMFNERIEILRDQPIAELTEQKTAVLQDVRHGEPIRVDKLKEYMATGLPQGNPSFEEQLIDLQGLVGKYTLSPQDYEAGLNALKDATQHTGPIEQVRTSFRSKLKAEQRFLAECLQGDLLHLGKALPQKTLRPAPLNELLSYYKPLMDRKAYAAHKAWIEQCHNTQSLLPPPSVSKYAVESAQVEGRLSMEEKQKIPGNSIRNFGKFLRENSGKLMTLGLATQVAAVQASHNTTQGDFVPEGNLPDRLSVMPMPDMHGGYVTSPGAKLETPMPRNTSIGERTAADSYGIDDKLAILPINATDTSEVDRHIGIDEEIRQEILNQFDTISTDLQELAKMFGTNEDTNRPLADRSGQTTLPRVVRSLPVEESTMCEIEQATLINFRNELQATLEQPNQASNNNCPLNYRADSCEELIKLMLCGYTHLKNGFLSANKNSVAIDEIIMLRNKLTELQEKSAKLFDVTTTSFSEKYNQKISKLKADIQGLQHLLKTLINQLKEKTIKSCISEIDSGRIESAVKDFKELNDYANYDQLSEIIEESYGYNKIDGVENIIKFVWDLPWLAHRAKGYEKLFEVMKKDGQLSNSKIFILADKVQQAIDEPNHFIVKQESNPALQNLINKIINSWESKLRNNNDNDQIKDFARKHSNAFQNNLPNLIDEAYSNNLGNAENIIQFIRNLPCFSDDAVAYSFLFKKMQSNGHLNSYQLLMLAYGVKECMEMPNYSNLDQSYKDKFTTLKNNLPSSVRDLIWSSRSRCTIKNDHYGEYLYTTSWWRGHAIHTWVPGDLDTDTYWALDMLENGKYFKLRNTYYDRYLALSDWKYNAERRGGMTKSSSSDSAISWMLIPEGGDNFLILNDYYRDYLYADAGKLNAARRYVFGWVPSSIPDSVKKGRRWRINC